MADYQILRPPYELKDESGALTVRSGCVSIKLDYQSARRTEHR